MKTASSCSIAIDKRGKKIGRGKNGGLWRYSCHVLMPAAACYFCRGGGKKLRGGDGLQHPGFNSICIFYSTVVKEPVLSPGQQIIYIFSRARCSQNIEFSVEDIKGSQARSSRGDKSRIA